MTELWWIKKHKPNLYFTQESSRVFIKNLIDQGDFSTEDKLIHGNKVLNWNTIRPSYRMRYYYEGYEEEMTSLLVKSKLKKYNEIYFEISPALPIIKVKTSYYFQHWIDFEAALNSQNGLVFTKNMELFMEFSGSSEWMLYSNFVIKKDTEYDS